MGSAHHNRNEQTRPPHSLRCHKHAALVPSMSQTEAEALQADIAERGIQVPLEITTAGVILDGRHRHQAALALGLEEVPVKAIDPARPVEYMLLAAIQRRHLTESQRAALVIELDEYRATATEATSRRQANLRHSGLDVASMPHRGRSRDRPRGG